MNALTDSLRRIVPSVGFLFIPILFLLAGCARDSTVFLVRHAEKGPGPDPALTPAGQVRAEALRDALDQAGISAIFVSSAQRTQQTAAPIASLLGITPIIVQLAGSPEAHADEVAAQVRARPVGSRTLVVGHSNTVPLILQRLGVTNPPTIAETEFDRFFIVLRRKDSATRVVEVNYGP